MAIPDDDVAKVRAATDLVGLVGEYSSLKRVGRRLQGLCPFHQEKTASFSVNPEQGLYYCFGCGASGDAISFMRATEGLDFVEAVERLAARAGIAIRHDAEGGAAAKADRERRQAMLDAMSAAVDFYHQRLLTHADAGPARQYLRSRGYDGDVVRRFRIGWAPAGWDHLVRALSKPARLLRETGLAFEASGGRMQDSFRGRVIFPIFDTSGHAIALGGRILPGAERGPKYKNSSETPIYSKRRTLYGLNWAKVDLVHSAEVVICEGYTDVIGFYVAGVPRAVATCGTSLTDEHLKILGGFARRVVLAFDADSAGQAAADRIYEAERRHGFEVAVASLPAGTDPGELAHKDPEALVASVTKAVPYLAFRVERALLAEDLHLADGRARAAEAAVRLVVEHPNPIVQDQYLANISGRTRIEPAKLRDLAIQLSATVGRRSKVSAGSPRQGRNVSGTAEPGDVSGPGVRAGAIASSQDEHNALSESGKAIPNFDPGIAESDSDVGQRPARSDSPVSPSAARRAGAAPVPERDALSLAVHHPQEMARYLHEVLFSDGQQRQAFLALAAAPSLHAAIDAAEPEVAELLRQIAVAPEPTTDVDGTILSLCVLAATRELGALSRAVRVAGDVGDTAQILRLSDSTDWLQAQIESIKALPLERARADLAVPLLAWLVERYGEES